ncbi:hypothetical protein L3Y34_010198 [Caenorhabditis briggsae]|uniref:Bromo domain-containing protein n=3 Tax=Caenorhabditis briggsae TaxID=6238 RepID=A0AAE8ZL19_CAEBR|nr:hypothetical protein L3Y34_010198 [Caenorhabditis briggsae]
MIYSFPDGMPTTRSANQPAPKRALTPDSDDGEEDDFVKKPSGRGRGGRGRGRGGRGRGRGGGATASDESSSGEGSSARGGRGRGRGSGRGGRGRAAKDGQPSAKRGRKKRAAASDSEDEGNVDSDHLQDELKKCLKLLKEFEKGSHSGYTFPFRTPVDTVALGLTDYHEIIKKPMDMSTMKKKIVGEEYDNAGEFKEDFKLMINNCLSYNNDGDPVSDMAIKFRKAFAAKWNKVFPDEKDNFAGEEGSDNGSGDEADQVESDGEDAEKDESVKVTETANTEKPGEAVAKTGDDSADRRRDAEEDESSDEEDGLDEEEATATSTSAATTATTVAEKKASPTPAAQVATSSEPVVAEAQATSSEAQATSFEVQDTSSEAQAVNNETVNAEDQPKPETVEVSAAAASEPASHAADSTTEADSTHV